MYKNIIEIENCDTFFKDDKDLFIGILKMNKVKSFFTKNVQIEKIIFSDTVDDVCITRNDILEEIIGILIKKITVVSCCNIKALELENVREVKLFDIRKIKSLNLPCCTKFEAGNLPLLRKIHLPSCLTFIFKGDNFLEKIDCPKCKKFEVEMCSSNELSLPHCENFSAHFISKNTKLKDLRKCVIFICKRSYISNVSLTRCVHFSIEECIVVGNVYLPRCEKFFVAKSTFPSTTLYTKAKHVVVQKNQTTKTLKAPNCKTLNLLCCKIENVIAENAKILEIYQCHKLKIWYFPVCVSIVTDKKKVKKAFLPKVDYMNIKSLEGDVYCPKFLKGTNYLFAGAPDFGDAIFYKNDIVFILKSKKLRLMISCYYKWRNFVC